MTDRTTLELHLLTASQLMELLSASPRLTRLAVSLTDLRRDIQAYLQAHPEDAEALDRLTITARDQAAVLAEGLVGHIPITDEELATLRGAVGHVDLGTALKVAMERGADLACRKIGRAIRESVNDVAQVRPRQGTARLVEEAARRLQEGVAGAATTRKSVLQQFDEARGNLRPAESARIQHLQLLAQLVDEALHRSPVPGHRQGC